MDLWPVHTDRLCFRSHNISNRVSDLRKIIGTVPIDIWKNIRFGIGIGQLCQCLHITTRTRLF